MIDLRARHHRRDDRLSQAARKPSRAWASAPRRDRRHHGLRGDRAASRADLRGARHEGAGGRSLREGRGLALHQVPLETLLAESDFVICLVVANEQTENLMNAANFARMKKSAYFLNLSRGNLVDEAALMRGAGEEADRRRRDGCRPRVRPEALARPRAPRRRDRDAAHRRPDAGRDRASGLRHGAAGRAISSPGRVPPGGGEPAESHAADAAWASTT